MNKFGNWIVKKFGGYTKQDVETAKANVRKHNVNDEILSRMRSGNIIVVILAHGYVSFTSVVIELGLDRSTVKVNMQKLCVTTETGLIYKFVAGGDIPYKVRSLNLRGVIYC